MRWEEFFTTKFGIWVNTCWSIDNILYASCRAVDYNAILLQTETEVESRDGNLTCRMFRLEDAVGHSSTSNPSGILTNEN